MKKWLLYIFLFVCFIGFTKLVDYLTRNSDEKFVIRDIRANFRGIVIEKIAKRKNLYLDVKLKRENKSDTIVDVSNFHNKIKIGDILVKKENTPYCLVIDRRIAIKYPFTLIPRKIFHNKDFLPAWKDSCNAGWKPYVVD